LYLDGFAMVGAGVLFENQAAVKSALILLGAALVLFGALLPRLSGPLEITTTGVKIPIAGVLERREVTRREAELRAPSRVNKLIGLYRSLIRFG